MKQPNHMPINI